MSGLEWLAVGVGPILAFVAVSIVILRRFRHQKQDLVGRIDQLGDRLEDQVAEQSVELTQSSTITASKEILQYPRDSDDLPEVGESSLLNSVNPVQESIALLGNRLEQKKPGPKQTQALVAGTKLDRFLIVEQIGYGGMGVVYKAYDPKLNRGVALKLIRGDYAKSSQSHDRLLREAQALARLSHPNVLHVYDVGTFGEQVFIAMALVEGQTFKEWLKEKQRSIKDIVEVMIAAGRGLSAAHKAGLIHRDFKPSNVIVGDNSQVRVVDFGMARSVPSEGKNPGDDKHAFEANDNLDLHELSLSSGSDLLSTPITHAGSIPGTPLYMAPEQLLGLNTDERTDQFSFCLVLYEALFGKRPFTAKTIGELKEKVIREQICPPSAQTDVPGWLWQIIRKGLSLKSVDRYPTMEALLDDLGKNPEEAERRQGIIRRRKLFVIALLILTIVLPIGIWYGLLFRKVQLCKNTQSEITGVWDNETKASIQKAFLSTKKPYALGTWERLEQNIDAYLAKWIHMRREVCESGLLRATQSEELFDLRMGCLKKRLGELKALVDVLTRADAGVVQKAVQASSSMTDIVICAEEQSLRAPYPPPTTAKTKEEVAAIREKLTVVDALSKIGKYREGLEMVKKLKQRAKGVGYRPIEAEVLYYLGVLLEETGEYRLAESTLFDAAQIAGDCKDASLVTNAMARLVWVVGHRQARYQEGLLLGRNAQVVLGLAGKDNKIQAKILHNMGALYNGKGEYDKAIEFISKAIAIGEKVLGSEHPKVASALGNMGNVFRNKGEYDKAIELQRKSLAIKEKTLGPEHPYVAYSLNNLSTVFQNQGKYEKAIEYQQKALAIIEKTLGFEHPQVASMLNNLGILYQIQGKHAEAFEYFMKTLSISEKALGPEHPQIAYSLEGIYDVFLSQGRHQEALKPLQRLVHICEKNTCNLGLYARGQFGLARTLMVLKRDKQRAIKLAKRAMDMFGKHPKAHQEEIEELNAWLKRHKIDN